MKLRNREVNVFSMSALDLFASAMGAFIFLAIIALPFFPNTGDSEESVAAVKAELAEAKAELSASQELAEKTQKELEQTSQELEVAKNELKEGISKFPIELVIAIDVSGSMQVPLNRLKEAINRLAIEIPKVTKEFKVGVVAYGGEGTFTTIPLMTITKSQRSNFIRQVDALRLNVGSTNVPEAVTRALSLYSVPNEKVRKAFVLIGDVGPYEIVNGREYELYDMPTMQAERVIRSGGGATVNKALEPQIIRQVKGFVETNNLSSVMAMYTGNATRRGDDSYYVIALTKNNSIPFFKSVAATGGESNGHYSEDSSDMLSMLLIAILSAS